MSLAFGKRSDTGHQAQEVATVVAPTENTADGDSAQPRVRHSALLVPVSRDYLAPARQALALLEAAHTDDGLQPRLALPDTPAAPTDQRVLVAPSTTHAMSQAAEVITNWRPDLPRPVLLVMRDAPLPPPPAVVDLVRTLEERIALHVELPYLPQARLLSDPGQALQVRGRRTRTTLKRLRELRKHLYLAAAWLVHSAPATRPVPVYEWQNHPGGPPAADPAPAPALTPTVSHHP